VPKGELWAGSPAKFMRPLKPEEISELTDSPARYAELAGEYMNVR